MMSKSHTESDLNSLRKAIRAARLVDEQLALQHLFSIDSSDPRIRTYISQQTARLVQQIRDTQSPDLLSLFLAEYNLTSEEGLALMTLSETLLRVPDNKTRDQLFSDKIANKNWSRHLSHSNSSVVNIATIALNVADMLVAQGHDESLKDKVKHALAILSNPLIRITTANIMSFFSSQFVFAENMVSALKKSSDNALYSYDMLGEAAWTAEDALRHYDSYKSALIAIGEENTQTDVFLANGISIKLSALHPKYDYMHKERVMSELAPRVLSLARLARQYNIALNIDAEESQRLDISLDIFDYVASHFTQSGWQGLGMVVQTYLKRAPHIIDWLYACSQKHQIKLMVRLAKGAYWDTEIKNSQVLGEKHFPVYTKKQNSDYSFLVCAQKALNMRDRLYAQFASHNAHSLMAVYHMAGDNQGYEIQRLHGMGESLHKILTQNYQVKSRIYAPVGVHKDLLAYLVRRLLENGSNSSFINHLFDETVPPEVLANDVFTAVRDDPAPFNSKIELPGEIYLPLRENSSGITLSEPDLVEQLEQQLSPWMKHRWSAESLPGTAGDSTKNIHKVLNPADLSDEVGTVKHADKAQLKQSIQTAVQTFKKQAVDHELLAKQLRLAARLYEENRTELMALAIREAGKTYQDAIDEVREAVDFLRFYANQSEQVFSQNKRKPLGIFICISPWNFPLAIYTGQIAAALVSGNCVIAKPAESTSLIAYRAVQLLHQAGIDKNVLQLTLGTGASTGSYLTSHSAIAGVAFTGSTIVANSIKNTLVNNNNAGARLIAETGGINAMVVDSTALPEQVAKDVLDSAFKSAGQRCSALRLLLVQQDAADDIITIIQGAMKQLTVGNPQNLSTDCGPVINQSAKTKLQAHIDNMQAKGKLLCQIETGPSTDNGYFVAPAIVKLDSIDELNEEFFGPILHIVSYQKDALPELINSFNNKGFGLTFAMHSRLESQIEFLCEKIRAGNIYVNRNQVGAIVGSQPFGGEGLSGTGPKAGGFISLNAYSQNTQATPAGDSRFIAGDFSPAEPLSLSSFDGFDDVKLDAVRKVFPELGDDFFSYLSSSYQKFSARKDLPGPTGETNELSYYPRGTVLCLGPGQSNALQQTLTALTLGNACLSVISEANYHRLTSLGLTNNTVQRLGSMPSEDFLLSDHYQAILWQGDPGSLEHIIARRNREILPVVSSIYESWRLITEQVITVNTTAAGGNASLLAL